MKHECELVKAIFFTPVVQCSCGSTLGGKKTQKTALEIENEFCVVTLLGVDNTAI